jgi:hypothetical protein
MHTIAISKNFAESCSIYCFDYKCLNLYPHLKRKNTCAIYRCKEGNRKLDDSTTETESFRWATTTCWSDATKFYYRSAYYSVDNLRDIIRLERKEDKTRTTKHALNVLTFTHRADNLPFQISSGTATPEMFFKNNCTSIIKMAALLIGSW